MRTHALQALAFYLVHIREGYRRDAAHAAACAYLRRKTGWGAPFACGALDRIIRDQPNSN